MKLKEFYEKPLKQAIGEMDLVDIKIYPDADGEVQAVLLKYIAPDAGRAPEGSPDENRLWS